MPEKEFLLALFICLLFVCLGIRALVSERIRTTGREALSHEEILYNHRSSYHGFLMLFLAAMIAITIAFKTGWISLPGIGPWACR